MKTTPVKIANITIGGPEFTVIAGPCSVESQEQFSSTGLAVKKSGASLLRGGIFKLRTRPESFQGLGSSAFSMAKEIKSQLGMGFISEVTDPRQIGDLDDVVDAFQVGSRNMHNYELLKELGKTDKPIVLKRGLSGLIKEWLHAAEYILSQGNEQIVLCERGIRTFETATRNTFDLNAVAYIKENTPFPIIADPSHATGKSSFVTPLSLAAAAAGADGLMIEVHPNPADAKSDGPQSLNFNEFNLLMTQLERVLESLDRKLGKLI